MFVDSGHLSFYHFVEEIRFRARDFGYTNDE
jgi:hypothetical protein